MPLLLDTSPLNPDEGLRACALSTVNYCYNPVRSLLSWMFSYTWPVGSVWILYSYFLSCFIVPMFKACRGLPWYNNPPPTTPTTVTVLWRLFHPWLVCERCAEVPVYLQTILNSRPAAVARCISLIGSLWLLITYYRLVHARL